MLTIEKQATPYTATLQLSNEDLIALFDSSWENIKDTIELDGFRKGHVPQTTAEKEIGFDKLYSNFLPELFFKELKAQDLDIVYSTDPLIYGLFDRTGTITLTTDVFLSPEVKLGPLENLETSVYKSQQIAILETEINTEIDKLRQSHSNLIKTNKPIQQTNTIILDFTGILNGKEIQGAKAIKYKMTIGQSNMIPGFEDELLNLTENSEKDFEIRFPDTYHRKQLAGQLVTFHVKIHEVFEHEFLSNEELALKENCTYDELFDKVKNELLQSKEEAQQKEITADLLKQLVDISEIGPIPTVCIYQELDQKLQQFVSNSGKTLEELEKQFPNFKDIFAKNNKPQIIEAIKTTMVLQELQKKLQVEVTEEEIQEFAMKKYNEVAEKDTHRYIVAESQVRIKKTLKYLVQSSK